MNDLYKHWDIVSLILYIIMALIGGLCLYIAKKKERNTGRKQKIFNSLPYIFWILVWTIFAAFRYINSGIGGTDAVMYRQYFDICLDSNIPSYFQHYDILYKVINIVIRFFTDNFHIFSILFYGFLVYSYILFLNEFSDKKTNIGAYILTFYIFLRGFNTFRTNLAVAFILIALVLQNRKKNVLPLILMLSTFFIQKASILYAFVFIFIILFGKGKLKIKHCILLSIISFFIGLFAQNVLINGLDIDLNGAYTAYAKRSISTSFFDNFWKICFGQLLLLGTMIIFNKDIKNNINNAKEYQNEKKLIWTICIFDFVMIPITYILNIWRGYEYLYLARLVMWNEIINIIKQKSTEKTRVIIDFVVIILFLAWMIFRIYNTWEDSSLMPYVFEPFINT